MREAIIIDTDPGQDDAVAILLALACGAQLDLRGIATVAGNVALAQTTINALRICDLAQRHDIQVYAGATRPLVYQLETAEYVCGPDGLAGANLSAPRRTPEAEHAVDFIIRTLRAVPDGGLTLCPVGPLTNIALAIEKDPSIVPLVKEVVIMGGSITGGNVNAAAEANIANDPEAAQIVFQAGWPLTMVGLDVGDKTLLTRKHIEALKKNPGPVSDFIYKVADFLIGLSEKFGETGTPMYDPLAVGVAIDSALVKAPAMHVDVETRGEFTRGETVANRRGANERNVLHHFPDGDRYVIEGIDKVEPNAKVCTEVNAEKFLQMFVSRIQGK